MRRTLMLVLPLLLMVPVAALAQVVDSTAVLPPATEPQSAVNLLDQISAMLASLTPILAILVTFGLGTKYLPFMSKIPNAVIPLLNAVIAFLMVFSGPAPAQAGIFGDFAHSLGFGAKSVGSLFLSVIASSVYETFLRSPFEKLGIFRAGITPAEKAAKIKVVGGE